MTNSLYATLTAYVKQAVANMQTADVLPADVDTSKITVEQPNDLSHGDFATNAALVLAKPARKNPREIAQNIADFLAQQTEVKSVEIAGPGFVNMRLKDSAFHDQLNSIVEQGSSYGASEIGAGTKVMVEFCSANPTGPLHAGHMRGTIHGDALCRILKKAGFDVWREYLINDAGQQIKVLVKTVHLRYQQLFGRDVEIPDGCYPGEYLIEVAEGLKQRDGDKWLNETDEAVLLTNLRDFCVDMMMVDIKRDLKDLGLADYDQFFSEYAMQQTGKPEEIFQQLIDKGLVYNGVLPTPKGKLVDDYEACELPLFKSSEYGDDMDRAMKNSRGEFTYFGSDVAYHQDKLDRGFETLIDVWGADHAGAVKRLVSAVDAISGKKGAIKVQLMQMAKFLKNGEPVKLSKRAGNIVTLRQILDEVGPDAARFWFLNRKPDTQFVFDLGKAIEKNNENPVFYAQYAYARMCSVFRQKQELGLEDSEPDFLQLTAQSEKELMQHLIQFPLFVERSASTYEPHRIAFYVIDLASKLHSWYNAEKFIVPENLPLTYARLKLVEATQIVLKESLSLLGVTAPEKM